MIVLAGRLIALVLLALVALPRRSASATPADSARRETPRFISRITVQVGDVIPPWSKEAQTATNPAERWSYDVLNWLHIKTRSQVIRRELLFAVGDTLDSLKLAETERNLRSYPFINEAETFVTPTGRDSAEVLVRTTDNFSLAPGTIVESGGGTTTLGALLIEKNLLGFGKEVAGQYIRQTNSSRHSVETEWLLQYKDPRLVGSHFAFDASASHGAVGNRYSAAIARPFYRLATRAAGGVTLDWFDGRTRLYRDELIVAELPNRRIIGSAWGARAWGDPFRRVKLTAAVGYENRAFRGAPLVRSGWLPRDTMRVNRRAFEPTLTLSREVSRQFRKMRSLDDYGIVEDVELGWNVGLTGGIGIPSQPTSDPYGIVGLSGRWSNVWGNHVTVAGGQSSVRLSETGINGPRSWSNLVTTGFLHHYYQGLPRQTLALNVSWRGGWRMDRPYRLRLGGDVGLRGYAANKFEGSRRMLANFEDRIYTPWRVLVYRIGFVAFADAGYAWPEDRPVGLMDLRSDAGFGLRVYNTHSATARVSRIDVAFALNGQRGFLIALGSEQLFDLFNRRPTPTR